MAMLEHAFLLGNQRSPPHVVDRREAVKRLEAGTDLPKRTLGRAVTVAVRSARCPCAVAVAADRAVRAGRRNCGVARRGAVRVGNAPLAGARAICIAVADWLAPGPEFGRPAVVLSTPETPCAGKGRPALRPLRSVTSRPARGRIRSRRWLERDLTGLARRAPKAVRPALAQGPASASAALAQRDPCTEGPVRARSDTAIRQVTPLADAIRHERFGARCHQRYRQCHDFPWSTVDSHPKQPSMSVPTHAPPPLPGIPAASRSGPRERRRGRRRPLYCLGGR